MQYLLELLPSLGVWNWLLLGCALLLLELVIPGVHFLWFGLAAVIVGALMMGLTAVAPEFAAGISWPVQLIIFALVSTAIVFVVRRYAIGAGSTSDEPLLNARSSQYIGRTVVVDVAISGGRGKVKIGDTVWLAQGNDAPVGSRVVVTGHDGPVLIVEPVAAS